MTPRRLLMAFFAAGLAAPLALAPQSFAADSPDQPSMSPSEIQNAIQALPPQLRGQILQQLQGKSTEELMHMSPDQARAAVEGLSPDMKAQLKSQWESMSSDQKAMLKSLNLHAIMEKVQAMTGPELAMIRKLVEKALGGGGDQDAR